MRGRECVAGDQRHPHLVEGVPVPGREGNNYGKLQAVTNDNDDIGWKN